MALLLRGGTRALIRQGDSVALLDLKTGAVTTRVQSQQGSIVAMAASAAGDRMAIGHASGVIEVWDTNQAPTRISVLQPGSPQRPNEPISRQFARSQLAIAFAGPARLVAIDGLGLTAWDLDGATVAAHLDIDREHWVGQPQILHVSDDGRRVIGSVYFAIVEEFRLPGSQGGPVERGALVQHLDGGFAPGRPRTNTTWNIPRSVPSRRRSAPTGRIWPARLPPV
jgi:hypothetical protein